MSLTAVNAGPGPVEGNRLDGSAVDVHLATTHPVSGVCRGGTDGCGGGPSPVDSEAAARLFERVRDAMVST